MTLSEHLNAFVEALPTISVEKKYWLIRTQSGSLYESFRGNGIVALEHDEVTLPFILDVERQFKNEPSKALTTIKNLVLRVHEERISKSGVDEELNYRRASLTASQIQKFAFNIKKGDVIIIPSSNSDLISFGEIVEDQLAVFTPEEERKTGVDVVLKKRVKWKKDINRIDLDPYLYRMFTAHQALIDVGAYADVIERSLQDFFVLDDEAHVIINVGTRSEISAADLFGMGTEILKFIDEFAEYHNLDIRSDDLKLTINLNSPGKLDLKSKIKQTTIVTTVFLFVIGGGYETKDGTTLKTPGLSAVIEAVDDFLTHKQEREMKEKIFNTYKDKLEIKTPEDMIKLLKQNSENKDKPQ